MVIQLPIDAIRDEVLAAAERAPVVVSSPTGSGKSTQVPRWFARLGRVLVVEPRRVACRSLAVRVAELEGARLGEAVGYTVRDDHRARASTRTTFATPGVVLRMLASSGDNALDSYATIIIDELHERSLDVDLICALLLGRYRGRLLAMSATLDGERVARYLGGAHIHAPGRVFPVVKHYLPGPKGTLLPEARGVEDRVVSAIRAARGDPGDILVFLPGKAEIGATAAALRRASDLDIETLTLHGGLTLAEQSRVFRGGSARRVILSTNVAETSLTIDGVGVVIDSGLVRQTRYFRGRGFLMLVPIASDSADQRAGRAGRTAPGICYRLWSPSARLAEATAPEVYRESLVPLVLAAASCGAAVDALPFLDPPKSHAVEAATEELQALGALDSAAGAAATSTLTERGRRLFGLPLDSHLGRLLVEAETQPPERFGDVVDLVAALSVGRPLFAGRRREADEDGELDHELRSGGSDAVALVRAVRRGDARMHGLNRFVLQEARAASRRLRKAFGLPARASDPEAPDRRSAAAFSEAIARLALAADPRCAHVKRVRKRRVAWSNGGTEIELGSSSVVDPEEVDAIAVLDSRAIGVGRRDTRVIATCALPLRLRAMADAGLGRDRLARVALTGDRSVVAVIDRVYARRVLATREDVPVGALAREGIRDLFVRGTLFRGAAGPALGRLAAARLYLRLVANRLEASDPEWECHPEWSGVGPHVPEDGEWVLRRLEVLGVESGDDATLLDPADLTPPPLPDSVRVLLDRSYPQEVSLGDATYKVEYDLSGRRVALHQTRGDRKEPPALSYLPRFTGFGIEVVARGKRRVLRRAP